MGGSITDVPGIEVGHAQHPAGSTGCTVILCRAGAVPGVDTRGGAPGTRETDCLRPENMVPMAHAIFLTGGSAYGLDCAAGIMRCLEEEKVGLDVGPTVVPIVAGAVLNDLAFTGAAARPDAGMGYNACRAGQRDGGPPGERGSRHRGGHREAGRERQGNGEGRPWHCKHPRGGPRGRSYRGGELQR